MIKGALLEMTLFDSAKETDNKLRWDTHVEGTRFSLYIPKWRVPQPWPSRIWVNVMPRRAPCEERSNLAPEDVELDSSLTHEPIVATVSRRTDHSETIRYRPLGDSKLWEVGEPYVPISLTCGQAERLRLIVLWDLTSRGEFRS